MEKLGRVHKLLLRFDLSTIPANATITSAILNLHGIDSNIDIYTPTETYVVFDIIDRTWTEMGVTWNNQPSISSTYPGIQITLPHIFNNNILIDMTSYIIDQFRSGLKADFMIKALNEIDLGQFVRITSREVGPPNAPFIRITYVTFLMHY